MWTAGEAFRRYGTQWGLPAAPGAREIGPAGLSIASWTIGNTAHLDLQPLDCHRVVLNAAQVRRHILIGEGRQMRDGPTQVGAVRIAPPGERAEAVIQGDNALAFIQVYIPRPALTLAAAYAERLAPDHLHDPGFETVDPLLLHLGIALSAIDPVVDRLYQETLSDAFMARLLRTYGALSGQPRQSLGASDVARIRTFVADHMSRSVSTDELARLCGRPRHGFAAAFRAQTGLPLHDFVTRLRVRHAARLIDRGGETLAIVAAACGFADQSHMTRRFVQVTGLTPRAFARR